MPCLPPQSAWRPHVQRTMVERDVQEAWRARNAGVVCWISVESTRKEIHAVNDKNKLKQQILRLESDLMDLDSRMSRMLDRLEYLEKKVEEGDRVTHTYPDEIFITGFEYTD